MVFTGTLSSPASICRAGFLPGLDSYLGALEHVVSASLLSWDTVPAGSLT